MAASPSPPPIPPDVFQRYAAAGRALQMGEASHAVLLAQDVIDTAPRFGPAHHLMGVALARLGDRAAAEKALRQAAALDKREPAAQTALADFLAEGGRMAEAERAYRAALALDRRFPPAAIGLAHLLLWAGRPGEAAQAVMPLAAAPNPPPQALDLHVRALAADGRPEEALTASRKAEAAGIANADLGSAQLLADLGRFAKRRQAFAPSWPVTPARRAPAGAWPGPCSPGRKGSTAPWPWSTKASWASGRPCWRRSRPAC